MEEEIQEILATYRSSINDDKILFSPHISPKKLTNAVSEFGGNDGVDDVLALIDSTTFGSAKDGLLLTRSALHVHNMLEAPFHVLLSDIKDVQFQGGLLESVLKINGTYVFRTNMPKKSHVALFAEMLIAIVDIVKRHSPNASLAQRAKESLRELKELFDEALLTEAEYTLNRPGYRGGRLV
jgi:hypothetical protein